MSRFDELISIFCFDDLMLNNLMIEKSKFPDFAMIFLMIALTNFNTLWPRY